MLKKILWIFAAVTVIFLFEQCVKDEDYGCGDPPPYFIAKSMNLSHWAEDIRKGQARKQEGPEITVDTAERYRLFIAFDVDYTTSARPRPSSVFFNTAYASDPCPTAGERGSKYPLTDIRITSNADFDSAHTKGILLNRYFREPYGLAATDSLQASDIKYLHKSFSITCIERPKLDLKHNFKVELTFSNGDKFSGETAPVTFKKK